MFVVVAFVFAGPILIISDKTLNLGEAVGPNSNFVTYEAPLAGLP